MCILHCGCTKRLSVIGRRLSTKSRKEGRFYTRNTSLDEFAGTLLLVFDSFFSFSLLEILRKHRFLPCNNVFAIE